jgi:N-acetylglutamate synthase-like GNAT family acetyltransferase/Mn-dependent DtxR family transcriptional regulator
MDFLTQLGPLALASRLRRLADRFTQDVSLLYKEMNIDFEPRWFSVFYLLSQSQEPLGVVEISKLLGVSHPAVNQVAGEMLQIGILQALKDDMDKRKRLLTLSEKGWEILPALQEVWARMRITLQGLLNTSGVDILGVLGRMESLMDEQGLYERFIKEQNPTLPAGIRIVEYQPQYRSAFKQLNLEWIQQYFKLEPMDEKILDNPEQEILAEGGVILFAMSLEDSTDLPEQALGTCSLIKKEPGIYELAKMAVTEKARGRQIGKHLLAACIEKARQLKAEKVVLETNSQLTTAINLYRRFGFVFIENPSEQHAHYERGDTHMKLDL